MVTDSIHNDRSIILTAGHCVFDEANGVFATNWMFIPDFDDGPSYTCGTTSTPRAFLR